MRIEIPHFAEWLGDTGPRTYAELIIWEFYAEAWEDTTHGPGAPTFAWDLALMHTNIAGGRAETMEAAQAAAESAIRESIARFHGNAPAR